MLSLRPTGQIQVKPYGLPPQLVDTSFVTDWISFSHTSTLSETYVLRGSGNPCHVGQQRACIVCVGKISVQESIIHEETLVAIRDRDSLRTISLWRREVGITWADVHWWSLWRFFRSCPSLFFFAHPPSLGSCGCKLSLEFWNLWWPILYLPLRLLWKAMEPKGCTCVAMTSYNLEAA